MTPELEKKIEEAADADFIVGKTRHVGTRERYLYEEKRESFLNGASFGRKGIYTEEEVKRLCSKAWLKIPNTVDMLESFDKWFEQNKKKD